MLHVPQQPTQRPEVGTGHHTPGNKGTLIEAHQKSEAGEMKTLPQTAYALRQAGTTNVSSRTWSVKLAYSIPADRFKRLLRKVICPD